MSSNEIIAGVFIILVFSWIFLLPNKIKGNLSLIFFIAFASFLAIYFIGLAWILCIFLLFQFDDLFIKIQSKKHQEITKIKDDITYLKSRL